MKFWDSSAIAPILVEENDTELRRNQLREDPHLLVWFGTYVEVESSLARKRREGFLNAVYLRTARNMLYDLAGHWDEVQPTVRVRERAVRCLHTHSLRAADAFQLAAALVTCRESPSSHSFYTGDLRLREAAEREGFRVDD